MKLPERLVRSAGDDRDVMSMDSCNCWDVLGCGREPGGRHAAALGVCPASSERRTDGLNHGKNGGRCCWAIAGTFCGGEARGDYAVKAGCLSCSFYDRVLREEGLELVPTPRILQMLRHEGESQLESPATSR